MKKKRFSKRKSDDFEFEYSIVDNETGKEYENNVNSLLNLLNNLNHKSNLLSYLDTISDLETEIVKLKDEVEYYKYKSGKCEEELLYLRRTNDKLKQKLNELGSKVDDKEVAVEVETCNIMETVFQLISYYITDIASLKNGQYGNDCCRINQITLLRQLEEELKK